MAFTPFIESDQPTMAAFNEKFSEAISTAINGALDAGTKLETGSYVGTGTYGSANPCTLSFDFTPKIIWIYAISEPYYMGGYSYNDTDESYTSGCFTITPDVLPTSYDTTHGLGPNGGNFSYGYAKKSSDGKQFSWYNTNDANSQLNTSNRTFHYIAFG